MTAGADTTSAAAALAATREPVQSKPWFIAGPIYDLVFFLFPPLGALALGMLLAVTGASELTVELGEEQITLAGFFLGTFIHAHLFIVFFRSHGNSMVRKTYPLRFLLIPVVLFGGMMATPWVLVGASVVATFWDVYHSGLQTFGIGRIYDGRAGNDPKAGRNLDIVLNHFLYAGPIVAGATMMAHFEDFNEFQSVGDTFFTKVPAFMESSQRYFTWTILGAGALFFVYYLFANVRMHREGRAVSLPKVFLFTTTGLCSIYTWGFNSWGEAFFIMNFFHALQYFGIIWWSENKNITKVMRVGDIRLANIGLGRPMAWLAFMGLAFGYGYLVETVENVKWFYAVTLVVSLMHFWYDGFIWSVRKGQVAKA